MIRRLEDQRRLAMLAGDAASLLGMFDTDLVYTHSDGSQDTCASYIGKVAAGHFVYHQLGFEVGNIEIHYGLALVHGWIHGEAEVKGNPRVLNCRYLAVWSGRGATWKLRAFQPTPVAENML
ncbi:nuclear transport factor 2 family protein [Leisingera methylohalidivorans]|uniref:Ketosteroid isomerase n=1 Tax=Leisingera methylohalidivorans DSM 14336 TaxID=999552 RepID=V9VWY3_9RHOB|nr:nuclear transport factor 2 family protein [Leisingera methylohalidivorans]AHD02234.1 ketosteroid isomerase [Leisingera methylohalidivorans DSM 14336]